MRGGATQSVSSVHGERSFQQNSFRKSFLPLLFLPPLLLPAVILRKEHPNILLGQLIFSALFSSALKLRAERASLRLHLGIFGIQLLDLWNAFQSLKGLLCGFVDQNFVPVGFQKLFAVPGLSIGNIGVSSFGIVDDVGFQPLDFVEPPLTLANLRLQFIGTLEIGLRLRHQLVDAVNVIFIQKQHHIRHLFEIEHRSPALVSGPLFL